jgi:hypothetical protein
MLLTILFGQSVFSMKIKSPTYDEPAHLTSGYLAITKKDFRYGADHPPLIKSLAALPLLFIDLALPENLNQLIEKDMFTLGRHFIFKPGNDVDQIIFLARLPLVLLSVLLGYYIFLWARELYGEMAGLLALTLYAFSPNILAHSRLVTTDFGATCFIFISCYHFKDYILDTSLRKLCIAGLFFGLALTVKYSTLILLPIFILYLFCKTLTPFKKGNFKNLFSNAKQNLIKQAVSLVKNLAVLFTIIYTVLFFAYGFRIDAVSLYLNGFETLQAVYFDIPQRYISYSLGEYLAHPKWYYPLLVLLVKTPVPLLILLVLALGTLRKRSTTVLSEFLLIIPAAAIFFTSFLDTETTGLRRLLPIYPFIFVFVTKLIPNSGSAENKKTIFADQPIILSFSLVITLWYILSSAKIFPDYLTYFNEFTGGPRSGIYYLDNSNIDWGQDLKRLKPYMDEQGIKKIKLIYSGTADPGYYKIKTEPVTLEEQSSGPQSGYYAISINYLNRLKKIPTIYEFGNAWKKEYKPIKVIGNTLYIYNFSAHETPG